VRLAILSGYNKSKHTIGLINELTKLNHVEIVLCISVRTFTKKRIYSLKKQYGLKRSIARFKHVFLGKSNQELAKETRPLEEFLKNNNIVDTSVAYSCRKFDIPYIPVADINGKKSIEYIIEKNVDLIIYSGGGIIRKGLIESSNNGIINAHGASLPFFRGMNGIEWSLFHNDKPNVTVHMMNSGIDTGDILQHYDINIEKSDDIGSLRGKSALQELFSLVDSVTNFDIYFDRRTKQQLGEGRQFFIMHDELKKIATKNLMKMNG